MNTIRLFSPRLRFLERLITASYPQLFARWLSINVLFAIGYYALATWVPEHGPSIPTDLSAGYRALDSVYFSLVTATTIGYGDIIPLGFSKVLAITQSTGALLVFAVLVGKLVSQKQDATLHEVHRMTFEGVFYHIRHVLFIVRKDLDELIEKANAHKKFEEQHWSNLSIAYLQAHSLVEEIPGLYHGYGYDLHNVDLKHEKLLFEGVHRTLQRTHKLLETLDAHHIDWRSHESSTQELHSFIDMVDAIMPLWHERSPFHEEKEFEEIRAMSAQLHREMKAKAKVRK